MERRKFIELNTWFLGLATLNVGGLISTVSCRQNNDSNEGFLLTAEDAFFLNELAEIIIPATDTPGGREADVGSFIVLIHNDCLSDEEQKENVGYLKSLRSFYYEELGGNFAKSSVDEWMSATQILESEKHEFYVRYKKLIVSAFLSSEVGTSVFMKFNLVPGRYDGCTTERAW